MAQPEKRVLIVHSFGSAAPPFTTHSIAFETELTERMGERLDLDEVSLDHARYADPEMQEALVAYLEKRQAKWQPDLVVPIGSPAGVFVEQYRERLFPRTPVLYAGMDRRRLRPDALQKNAAFVGESFNLPGFVEDILQLKPDTTNIVCVIGASQVERYWAAAFQSEFAPFTNRVGFTWFNDLPFDQMLERVKKLPPRSFIFFILLMRDAAGVTLNADDALRRMSEVANAPVNSIYDYQLGLGIVGGRLYRAEFEAIEAARMAVRILHGEPATNFAPEIIGPIGSQYNWRELRRWHITEESLSPGSIVKFRVPSVWERNRGWLIAGLSLVVLQSALITGLVLNLRRRRTAERSLRESEERMKLAASAADLGMWEWDFASKKIWVEGRGRERIGVGDEGDSGYGRFMRTVHPDDRDSVAQALAKAIAGDGTFEHVHRRVLPDGQVRWIGARARVEFDAVHKPLKMRGVGIDITARKVAEEQAKLAEAEAQRLEQELAHVGRVSMLGELAGSLAHELNQPLTAIVSSAEAAERFMEAERRNDEEVRDALKDILEQGQRAGEIIAKIRAMLRKDPGQMARQDINLAVRDVLEMARSDLVIRRVTPVLRLDAQLPPVSGHGVQLRQVLLNLVMNACDAMSDVPAEQRHLTIESRRVTPDEVEVSVADTGSGFSEEMLQHAFEPFRTSKAKGLGLGLAICRSIIRTHGGSLFAANNPDKGATLRFTLPVQNGSEA